METAYKNSSVQGTTSTSTFDTLYSTPTGTQAVISTIVVCNQSPATVTFRLAITSSAGTPIAKEYLFYDVNLDGSDSVGLTLGITLSANQFIRISSSANTCSFTAFVSEIS